MIYRASRMLKLLSMGALLCGVVAMPLMLCSLLLYDETSGVNTACTETIRSNFMSGYKSKSFNTIITPMRNTNQKTTGKLSGLSQPIKTSIKNYSLSELTSAAACAPLKSLNFVHSSGDKLQTYRYPADQAYFLDSASVQCGNNVELFVAIKSSFHNFHRRNVCRKSWLSDTACGMYNGSASRLCRWAMRRMSYAFFVLTPADQSPEQANEQLEHNDIVQVSLVEHYHNLTLKTTSAMYWAVSRCRRAKYVLTMDDDVMLNVTNLWRVITTFAVNNKSEKGIGSDKDFLSVDETFRLLTSSRNDLDLELFLAGRVVRNPSVLRSGTFSTPFSVYSSTHYPSHFPGWFTLMSVDAADLILRVALCTEQFWVDDVYLFGMIPEFLGVSRLHLGSFKSVKMYNETFGATDVGLLLGN